jgi:hypothetical protein
VKTLFATMVIVALFSCSKELPAAKLPAKPLSLSAFSSMLTKDNSYVVADYYNSAAKLNVPVVNSEDTYTFDGAVSDGWISSKLPCIEYHYNFRVFESADSILFDWLDFNIVPQTFILTEYQAGEWFILKNGDTYTKYALVNK